MKSNLFKSIVLAVAILPFTTLTVFATPMTLYFTGQFANVTWQYGTVGLGAVVNGDEFSGTATFDPAADLACCYPPDDEVHMGVGYLSFTLTDLRTGGTVTNVGMDSQVGMTSLNRSSTTAYYNFSGQGINGISGYDYRHDGVGVPTANEILEFTSYDYNNPITLFSDPNGGLKFDQPVNLTNATVNFYISEWRQNYGNNFAKLNLTYFGFTDPYALPPPTTVPEPESVSLMLAALGLLGVMTRRKSRLPN